MTCRHPKLTESDNFTALNIEMDDQRGNVIGSFQWKRYICDECGNLITVLHAVVEKPKKDGN